MTHISSHHSPKGRYLAYLRVSTLRQGEGVSLLTQRETIAAFAARKHLRVTGWYEEKVTAAKRGRPVFREILKLLRGRKADVDSESDPTVITGSMNWSANGDDTNDENTLIIHDAAVANQFYQEFAARLYMGFGVVDFLK